MADKDLKFLRDFAAGTDAHMQALRLTFAQMLSAPMVIDPYPMPIKQGRCLDAAVVNPLLLGRTDKERAKMIGRYNGYLQGDRIDIWMKRQNTLKFLAVADRAAAQFRMALPTQKPSRKKAPR